jgi:hypothetical protein
MNRSMVKIPTLFFFFGGVLVSPSWFNEREREIKVSSAMSFSFSFSEPKKKLKVYSEGVFFVSFYEFEK